ncbi:MAG TPA: acyl-CoA desaturase, partial [Acidimicrobiales bacterium]
MTATLTPPTTTSKAKAAPKTKAAPARPAADHHTPPATTGPISRPGQLTDEELAAFGEEMDRIRDEVLDSLGDADADYIRRVITAQRRLEAVGRLTLMAGLFPPAWILGTTALATAKILENMEIGHNVMHGQWDWMRDPEIHSTSWEWDTVCPSSQWKHSHNNVHHTWTNILGKDRDVGYGILRMSEDQKWSPIALGQPLYAALLGLLFQWGVGLHDIDLEAVITGRTEPAVAKAKLAEMGRKAAKQVGKDYVLFPALAGPAFLPVLTGNLVANLARNVWSFAIIFCGHFPDGAEMFARDEVVDEKRGGWYVRQLLGSTNISGGRLLHLLSGNLSFQMEHHAFPDLPSNRYVEVAPKVQDACQRYGIPYTAASLPQQVLSTAKRICRLALPNS